MTARTKNKTANTILNMIDLRFNQLEAAMRGEQGVRREADLAPAGSSGKQSSAKASSESVRPNMQNLFDRTSMTLVSCFPYDNVCRCSSRKPATLLGARSPP
jgi:hypothetical protein